MRLGFVIIIVGAFVPRLKTSLPSLLSPLPLQIVGLEQHPQLLMGMRHNEDFGGYSLGWS